jgi:transposase
MSDYISGSDRNQTILFPETIEDYIEDDNPVRFIDVYVNSLNLTDLGFKHAIPNQKGRPPYHPGDLIKLYVYGWLNQIRSSRRLEQATYRNLELIWLIRKLHPDFKTIADFRKDNREALKSVCHEFTLLCKKLDLFGCELIAIDGSKFKAVNSTKRTFNQTDINRSMAKIDKRIAVYLQVLDQQDDLETDIQKPSSKHLNEQINHLQSSKEELLQLQQKLQTSAEKQVSLTDPDSRKMRMGDGGTDVCYNVQVATDSKHKLIVVHEVTNDINDQNQLSNVATQAKETLGSEKIEATADKGYFKTEEIKKCAERNITCYVPQPRKSQNRKLGLYTDKDFSYDRKNDCYICPAKQVLTFRFEYMKGNRKKRVYTTSNCKSCALKGKCTRSKSNHRRIYRWAHEHIIEDMQHRMALHPEKVNIRKELVEHPFGTIKHWMGYDGFLTKGLDNVAVEMSLNVLAYNLKRVLKIVGVKQLIRMVA